ncbi:hypothetical protein PCASD_09118 [Puccinia coronata f. sp. avenae]|uniref:Uncharacterized protein n=1 Tax=Puccinia coronata f. sp. avenae TaxID=200324 RepID=A0A2N5V4H6_9BASI|nr:hypothetical protein PCASD_09118 [Puccinia coronata f. sp. avenae]
MHNFGVIIRLKLHRPDQGCITAGINRSNTAVRAVLEQPCSTGGWTGTVRPKHLPAGRTGLSDQFLGPVAQDQPGTVGQICPTSWLSLRSDSVRPTTGRTRLFEHCSSSRVRPVNAGSASTHTVIALGKSYVVSTTTEVALRGDGVVPSLYRAKPVKDCQSQLKTASADVESTIESLAADGSSDWPDDVSAGYCVGYHPGNSTSLPGSIGGTFGNVKSPLGCLISSRSNVKSAPVDVTSAPIDVTSDVVDATSAGSCIGRLNRCNIGSKCPISVSSQKLISHYKPLSSSSIDGTAGINRSNTAVRAVLEQPCSTGGRTGTVQPKHLPAGRTGLSDQFLGPIAQDQPGPVGQICPTSWLSLRSDSVRPTTGQTRLFKHRSSSRVQPVNAGSADYN